MAGRDLFAQAPAQGRNLLAEEPAPQQQESTFVEKAGQVMDGVTAVPRAAADVARTMVAGSISEPAAGLAGLGAAGLAGAGLIDSEGGSAAGDTVEAVREAMAVEPRSELGAQVLGAIGELSEPVAKGVESAARYFGVNMEEMARAMGFGDERQAAAGALGESLPTIAGLALGGGSAGKSLSRVSPATRERIDPTISTPFTKQSPAKERIAEKIAEGSTENDLAGYMVNGKGRVAKDPVAKETIKQGFDEGVVAAIKGSTGADKSVMLKMLDTLERGRADARFGAANRPSDHIGDGLRDRILHIRNENRRAGKQLDAAANSLKGKPVNYEPAVRSFLDDLDGMGIQLDDANKPIFKGSDVEGKGKGVNQARKVLDNVISRLRDTANNPDAHSAHKLKRYIDEQVNYGKSERGLGGNVERVLKRLRNSIDTELDAQFSEYNAANTAYADTIGALDAFQEVAGRKMQLEGPNADKAIGTLSRRLMSNAQSRVTLLDAVDQVNDVAKRYGMDVNDDIMTQVMFMDELDSMFGTQAKTSLAGELEKGVARGIVDAKGTAIEAGAKKAASVVSRMRGINPEGAISSLRALLQRESGQLPAPRPPNQSTLPAGRP